MRRPIPKAERLHDWLSPRTFSSELNRLLKRHNCGNEYYQWHRDGSHASTFAQHACATAVRLLRQGQDGCGYSVPDFEVKLRNKQVMRVEATWADFEGRKLVEESRSWKAGEIRYDGGLETLSTRRLEIPKALTRVVGNKIAKTYAPGTSLFIDLNLGTHDHWRTEIEQDILEYTQPAADRFRSVWVYWSNRLYRCHPNPSVGHAGSFRPTHVMLGSWRHFTPLSRLYAG